MIRSDKLSDEAMKNDLIDDKLSNYLIWFTSDALFVSCLLQEYVSKPFLWKLRCEIQSD